MNSQNENFENAIIRLVNNIESFIEINYARQEVKLKVSDHINNYQKLNRFILISRSFNS